MKRIQPSKLKTNIKPLIFMKEPDIDTIISALAGILLKDRTEFEKAAKRDAALLNVNAVNYLKTRFHNPPKTPPGIDEGQFGLGQWMAVCQYVIFELLYNLRETALPLVEEVAFGAYDWTQATALEVLCRWHVDGTLSRSVITEINRRIGDMRYETHLYFGRSLIVRKKDDDRFGGILLEIDNTSFQEALKEFEQD